MARPQLIRKHEAARCTPI